MISVKMLPKSISVRQKYIELGRQRMISSSSHKPTMLVGAKLGTPVGIAVGTGPVGSLEG